MNPLLSLFSVLSRHSLFCSLITLSPRLVALTSRLRSLAHFSLGLALMSQTQARRCGLCRHYLALSRRLHCTHCTHLGVTVKGVSAAHFLSQVTVNGGATSGYYFASGDFPVLLSITLLQNNPPELHFLAGSTVSNRLSFSVDVLANFDNDLGIPFSPVLNDAIRFSYVAHVMLVFPVVFYPLRINLDGHIFSSSSRTLLQDNLRFT
ncbi:hypothetical protein HN51_001210, partial [Arachis hypogaea]